MATPLDDFWKLLVDSRLLAAAECADLSAAFARVRGADQANPKALCAWLMDRGMLSRYQCRLLLAGRTGPFFFGDYRVYDRIESGKLAGLFRAAHVQKGEPVLLYFFTGSATQDLRRWLPVEARAQLAIGVKHPNVSRVDELVQADGYKFAVLEGLDGQTLEELAAGKPLPAADVCRYLRKAAAGLARLHNLNQTHGDVRPDNLLLEHSGQLKLLHFPLSRDPLGPSSVLDPRNADFLAPECSAPGGRSPDALSDIYSLGCTAYFLLAGQPPFAGGEASDKPRRHATETSVPLDELAGVAAPFARLVTRMMAKDPAGRPATAMQVSDDLAALPSLGEANEKSGAEPSPERPKTQAAAAPRPAAHANGGPAPATNIGGSSTKRAAEPSAAATASPATRPSKSPSPVPAATSPKPSAGSKAGAGSKASAAAPAGSAARAPAVAAARSATAKPPAKPKPASVTAVPPPPPPGVQPGGWPACNGPLPHAVGSGPPPAPPAAPAVVGAPPVPPAVSTFTPQHPAFAQQAMPVMGMAVGAAHPAGPPMIAGQPAVAVPVMAAPMMGMPAFAPPGFATSVAPAYAAPVEEMAPTMSAPAPAFDSAVMNVLDDVAAAPVRSSKGSGRPSAARRTGKQSQGLSPQTLGLGIGAIGIVVVVLLVVVMSRPGAPPPDEPPVLAENNVRDTETTKTKKASTDDPDSADGSDPVAMAKDSGEGDPGPPKKDSAAKISNEPKVVEDDGKSLWVEPTSGPPVDVQYLPPGTQVLLALRPAELLRGSEGEKVLTALGPGGVSAKAELEKITGVPLAEMEQVVVAFSSLEKGPPQAAFVVHLAQSRPREQMLAALNNPSQATDGKDYCTGGAWAYYWPPAGKDKVLAICGAKEMAEVVDMDGAPPMRKEMEKLLRQTDASRQFTLLVAPNYLQNDGKSLLDGELERLRDPLNNFFGAGVQAAALSLNWGQDFFAELRLYSTDVGPEELSRTTRDQVAKIAQQVEDYLNALNPSPYGKAVLARFPQMLRVVDEYTRVGEEENQAILRCYLPLSAGHNLVMGAELALFERGGGGAGGAATAQKKPSGPAEALKQKITLSFGRDTLEKTMEMIAREIDTEVVIIGGDLQLEGITKNQSFGLDEKDKPAGEILRIVMMKANPDGKLVYVFKPKNPGEKDIIFITTRAAAEKRGDKLPPELAAAAPDAPKAKAKK